MSNDERLFRNAKRRVQYATDPAYREQMLNRKRMRYASDPELRARMIAANKAWREKARNTL